MSQFFTSVTAGNLPPTVVETITGNTGGPEAAIANNFNIVTANSTIKFAGTPGTETLDFGLSNLILGSSGTSITGAALGNIGLGVTALSSLTSGQGNTAIGLASGQDLTSAIANTLVGYNSGADITTASYNSAIGESSLQTLKTGSGRNVAIGVDSLISLATGDNNTCIGYNSGLSYTTSESNNIIVGVNTGTVGESATIRIGLQGTQTRAFLAGVTGVTVANTNIVTINSSTGQLGSVAIAEVISWVNVTGITQAMAVNTGYLANNVALVTFTLPATAVQFSTIEVVGHGAGGWKISQNAGQQIIFGNTATTVGVTGSLASTNANDCVQFIASVGGASTVWTVQSSVGNLTVA